MIKSEQKWHRWKNALSSAILIYYSRNAKCYTNLAFWWDLSIPYKSLKCLLAQTWWINKGLDKESNLYFEWQNYCSLKYDDTIWSPIDKSINLETKKKIISATQEKWVFNARSRKVSMPKTSLNKPPDFGLITTKCCKLFFR